MSEVDDKSAALIEEGLTPGEADYLTSGGRNAEGLSPPSDDGDAPGMTAAAPPARSEPGFESLQRELKAREDALAAERAQTQEHRERATRLDERLRIFQQAVEPEPAKPAAPPDPESDPFGYMRYLGEQVTGLAGKTDQVATNFQERHAAAELKATYLDDAKQFATRQPDFGPAYNWLMANRDAELAAAGYTDPAERARIINLDERDIVARALMARQTNPNAVGPAQIIYGLAKARGFQAPAVRQAAGAPAPSGMRQSASRSLSSAGGAPAPTGIDLAKLADMDDGEYLAWKSSLSPAQHKQLANLLGAPR